MGVAWNSGKMIWDTTNPGTYTYDAETGTYVLVTTSSTPIVATTPVPGKVSRYPSVWPADQYYLPASGDYQGTRVFSQTTGWMVSAKPRSPALTDGTSVVECESCHAPHGAGDATSGGVHFLNTMDMSKLCTNCHEQP